jgi:hypothetical protein
MNLMMLLSLPIGVLRRAARSAPASPAAGIPPEAAADEDPTCGCGWFDSSHELLAGLAVIEHDVVDITQSLRLLSDDCAVC